MPEKRKNKPYILIGMPLAPDRRADIQAGLFCGRLSVSNRVDYDGRAAHEVCQARNLIIQNFLKEKKYTHLFFLDADTVPPNNAIAKLLTADKDVVAGVTPMFNAGRKLWSVSMGINGNVFDWRWIPYQCLPTKLFKPYGIGGTTMLIKRRVLEKLEFPYFYTHYNKDGGRVGEDIYFGNKVHKAGFEIWCDPSIKCRHYQRRDLAEML